MSGENATVHTVSVATFACPSDPRAGTPVPLDANALSRYGVAAAPGGRSYMVLTSYAGCAGSLEVIALPLASNNCVVPPPSIAQSDGCFNDVSPLRLSAVLDGLSNTVFMEERATIVLRSFARANRNRAAKHGWYVTGNFGDTLVSNCYPPNAFKKVAVGAEKATADAGSSMHPGGLNILMGDGSVRFAKETIQSWSSDPGTGEPAGIVKARGGWWDSVPSPGVWQALSTRAGGEVVGDF